MPEKLSSLPILSRRQAMMAAVGAAAMLTGGAALAQQPVGILETGSTLLYPLFNLWVAEYQKTHSGVRITTQGTGSGTGISEAISGIAQIGASDAYMSNAQMRAPRSAGLLNIPLAVSSQMVNYNLPGLSNTNLKLSGPLLAGIYMGKITHWDDPKIKEINPGAGLPHQRIIPVHRSDGSGDTFIFTQYLAASAPEWGSLGYGTTISWPAVQGSIGAVGNPGMLNAAKGTRYSIAYIGISFREATRNARLGEAALENSDGKFVVPDEKTVAAAVQAMAAKTPKDGRVSLIFAPGPQSYPIVNYEYAIVKQKQPSPEVAKTLSNFLLWVLDPQGGSAAHFLQQVGFVALPPMVRRLSEAQIRSIA